MLDVPAVSDGSRNGVGSMRSSYDGRLENRAARSQRDASEQLCGSSTEMPHSRTVEREAAAGAQLSVGMPHSLPTWNRGLRHVNPKQEEQ